MKKAKKNLLYGFFSQLAIFALGIIIPRLVIISYGSETNGLISSVNQVYTYLALLEAGIGMSTLNALYKPISANDRKSISDIMCASQSYYRKMALYYLVGVIIFSIVFPFITESNINRLTIAAVCIFQGIANVMVFYFIASYRELFAADGRNYIVSNLSLAVYLLTSIGKIILTTLGVNIVFLQILHIFINVIQIWIVQLYCRKIYPWLRMKKTKNLGLLNQRRAFLVHQVSGTVFSCTDVVILSVFCNFSVASVYTVYNMVFSSLFALIDASFRGLKFILGQAYNEDLERYIKIHDAYESVYTMSIYVIYSVAYILIFPFIRFYTSGVSDENYIVAYLPLLFVLIQLLSSIRAISSNLITVAGHAGATQSRSIAEAIIYLFASLILVNIIGIYGVLLGTIIALLYRTNDIILYANLKILQRKPWKTYKTFLSFTAVFAMIALFESKVPLKIDGILSFAIYGCVMVVLVSIIYILVLAVTDQKSLKFMISYIKNRRI